MQSVILGRLKGGPLAETGVMQGMSGSPVYIDGRLAGAVALGFPLAKEPIAGIRPIEEMLRVDPDTKTGWPRFRAPACSAARRASKKSPHPYRFRASRRRRWSSLLPSCATWAWIRGRESLAGAHLRISW